MSGVIDADGVQWERCNGCGEFTMMRHLCYEEATVKYEYGRDLCPKCWHEIHEVGQPSERPCMFILKAPDGTYEVCHDIKDWRAPWNTSGDC